MMVLVWFIWHSNVMFSFILYSKAKSAHSKFRTPHHTRTHLTKLCCIVSTVAQCSTITQTLCKDQCNLLKDILQEKYGYVVLISWMPFLHHYLKTYHKILKMEKYNSSLTLSILYYRMVMCWYTDEDWPI